MHIKFHAILIYYLNMYVFDYQNTVAVKIPSVHISACLRCPSFLIPGVFVIEIGTKGDDPASSSIFSNSQHTKKKKCAVRY